MFERLPPLHTDIVIVTGLYFETAPALPAVDPNRTDVACFIGYVARRARAPLPAHMREELRRAGWLDGPWARSATALEALEQLPVTVESWDAFDNLFAWEQRAVADGGAAQCATYLGAAVRSFFATGGVRAVIVRVGDPWPYVEPDLQHAQNRLERIRRLVPDYAGPGFPALPFDATDPSHWLGIHHVYGLPDVSLICLPDLPDVFAQTPAAVPAAFNPPPLPETFVECSDDEAPDHADFALRLLAAPRCGDGYESWGMAVGLIRDFLARHRRDALFFGALPLPHVDARRPGRDGPVHAEADLLGFLRYAGVFEPEGGAVSAAATSAFVQLGYPWLRTRRSADLPQSLEPPDGMLAGLAAANAIRRGTFRSMAGSLLPDVIEPVPMPAWGVGSGSPGEQLAERLCLIAPEPGGIALQSDVTTAFDGAWRPGGVSRLLSAVLRAGHRYGDAHLFEANGPALWANVRRSMVALLTGFWEQGGLGGATPSAAFEVRCDRSTMTQNDIDAGRLIVEISVLPAAAVERITIVLNLASGAPAQAAIREVA